LHKANRNRKLDLFVLPLWNNPLVLREIYIQPLRFQTCAIKTAIKLVIKQFNNTKTPLKFLISTIVTKNDITFDKINKLY